MSDAPFSLDSFESATVAPLILSRGDALVVSTRHALSVEQVDRFSAMAEKVGLRVLVLDGSLVLEAVVMQPRTQEAAS